MSERDRNFVKWNSLKVPPPKDRAILVTTAGPEVDLAFWDENTQCYRDYFFRQKLLMSYPSVFAWAEVPEPADYGETIDVHNRFLEAAHKRFLDPNTQKKLAEKARALIVSGQQLPKPVTELTGDEQKMFEIIASMSGFIRFISDFLDPDSRVSQARYDLLDANNEVLTDSVKMS